MASFSNLCCPHCQSTLQARRALPVGEEFDCLKCKSPVRIDIAADKSLTVTKIEKANAPTPVAAPHTPPPIRCSIDRSVPVAAPYLAPAPNRRKLIAAVALSLLFSVGGTALAYLCFLQEHPPTPPVIQAQAAPKKDADEPKPAEPVKQVQTAPTVINPAAKPAPQEVTPQPKQEEPAPLPKQDPPPVKIAEQPKVEVPPPNPMPEMKPPAPDAEMIARTQRFLEQQKQIDEAIARGVQYLKNESLPNGGHVIGRAALRGLTLLECGVPANDLVIQQIALLVRNGVKDLRETYDSSLAILFLDRLGDSRDTPFIQVLALRLVAGQTMSGGWNYPVPPLDLPEMQQLITFLQLTRPKLRTPTPLVRNDPPPFLVPLTERPVLQTPLPNENGPLPNPLDKKSDPPLPTPIHDDPLLNLRTLLPGLHLPEFPNSLEKNGTNSLPKSKKNGDLKQKATPNQPKSPDGSASSPVREIADPRPVVTIPKSSEEKPAPTKPKIRPKSRIDAPANGQVIPPQSLAARLRELPVVLSQTKERGKIVLPEGGRDDNSNSQFALLALWAARRHGVATERVLFLAEQRYRQWQNSDGGWGYQRGQASSPAMTGVGLLGLAMGHGADFELAAKDHAMAPAYTDPAIERGLARFATFIGSPEPDGKKALIQNLYFLWSVERVAMLYKLRNIGGKDWYGWGAQSLLVNQNADGSWVSASYPGSHDKSIDSCFALLFLRRSNLVEDLATNITQRIAVDAKAPGGKN